MQRMTSAKVAMEHLDRIVSEIAIEQLAHIRDVDRHTKEIARLRTDLGQIRAYIYDKAAKE
jgi:hypothetical protein